MTRRPTRPRAAALLPLALAGLALLAPAAASADCAAGGAWAWPPEEAALPLQPMILLDAYGQQRSTVSMLLEGASAVLVAGDRVVPLKVEAVNVGDRDMAQAVLGATRPLEPKTRYALEVRPGIMQQPLTAPGTPPPPKPRPLATWTTAAGPTAPLALAAPPTVSGESYALFGCGPASHRRVDVRASSGAPIAVEVELAEVGGAASRYVVPLTDGVLSIGHGMCTGPFDPTGADRRFRATLTVRDAAGRRAPPHTVTFRGVDPSPGPR